MLLNKVSTRFLLLLTFFVFILSCKRNKTSWDTDFTIPVAYTTLRPNNLISDSLFIKDSANNIVFFYKGQLNNLANEVVTIPDTSLDFDYRYFGANTVLPPATEFFPINFPLDFDLKGIKLKKAKLDAGSIIISAKNYTNIPLKITLKIPGAKLNGIPLFTSNEVAGKQNGVPGIINTSISLQDYDLNLFNSSTNTYNALGQQLIIATGDTPTLDSIYFLDKIEISIKFLGLLPNYVTGYFGKLEQTFNSGPTLFDFKKILNAEQIQLQKASLDLDFKNYIGVDLRTDIYTFSGKNTSNGVIKNLKLNNNSPIRLNLIKASSNTNTYDVISPSATKYTFNNSNSNLVDFLNNIPDALSLNGKLTLNPLGININNFGDFYKRGQLINTDYKITIPGKFSFKNLKVQIDGTIDIQNKDDLDQFNEGNLTLYSSNQFPYAIQLQGYFLDDQNQIIDSIFTSKAKIDAALDDALSGKLMPSKNKNTYALSLDQKALLKKYAKVRWVGLLNSRDNQFFEIKDSYALELKLVANAIINLKYD
jgi:hypothetical protein